jgi:MTH538 TIR-like domain (DUF1863)
MSKVVKALMCTDSQNGQGHCIMRFAAFISYKHTDPDQRWAKWLHRKLETYRVPRGVLAPHLVTRRIGRVFRDEEEFAAGNDLGEMIKGALKESSHLIVICSPAAASSTYVNQEIEEFIALGRANKILSLLVKGEPRSAFPPALVKVFNEPLAADLRRASVSGRRLAFLRIAAPLIGCTFDDLRQRDWQRTKRRIKIWFSTVTICSFMIFSIRYGLYRLSLENTSIGTYHLVVKQGVDFLKPLLGSNQTYMDVSDPLYEVSPKGQALFAPSNAIYFPSFNNKYIYGWLNRFYFDELDQISNNNAPLAESFYKQLRVTQSDDSLRLNEALRNAIPYALDVVQAHRLTGDEILISLQQAIETSDPKSKALTLNVINEIFSEKVNTISLTVKTIKECNSNTTKIVKALSYDPDPTFLVQCATTLINSKQWGNAAPIVVRFKLPHSAISSWLTTALNSGNAEEFLAAAEIVTEADLKEPAIFAALHSRLTDNTANIKTAAALALWSNGVGESLVRSRVRELVARKDTPPTYYVALLRSGISDNEVIHSLIAQLTSVGAGDFTDGWLVSRPEAFDVIDKFKTSVPFDHCLSEEISKHLEDYAQAILTARAVMFGCRDPSFLTRLDDLIRDGVPGLVGIMVDPIISEAYGRMLFDDAQHDFPEELNVLWGLLNSYRSESSRNYRLAIQYALVDLVISAKSSAEEHRRHAVVIGKIRGWADDIAPQHRSAFVSMDKLIREGVLRRELLLARTQN